MPTANAPKLMTRTVLGVAVAAAFALSGCGAGQVTQTDTMVAAVPGASAQLVNEAENIRIELRDLMVQFGDVEGYKAGSSAPLIVRIFNSGLIDDTLVGVESPDGSGVTMTGNQEPAAPSPSDDPSEGASDAPDDPTTSPAPAPISSQIAAQGYLLLVPGEGPYLQLDGLTEDLKPGQSVSVTFVFEKAGSVTVDIPVGPPTEELEREHAETGEEEGH